jgi:hypothetical protein
LPSTCLACHARIEPVHRHSRGLRMGVIPQESIPQSQEIR